MMKARTKVVFVDENEEEILYKGYLERELLQRVTSNSGSNREILHVPWASAFNKNVYNGTKDVN